MNKAVLVLASILMSGVIAHADDAMPNSESQAAPAAESTEQKSFFESRTLEDIQQMVNVDTKTMEEGSADMSSMGG